MKTEDIITLKELIHNNDHIVVIPHNNPDGDAMGSTLALYLILKKLNKKVTLISPNRYPHFLSWLPGAEDVLFFDENVESAKKIIEEATLIFTLDYNAFHRTGEALQQVLEQVDASFVMIDHHQMPDDYATVTISDTSFGSTCELLYNTLVSLELQDYIDKDIATCIYTGIVTDSGSFRFVKTTGNTHRVVGQLIDYGVDNPKVHESLFSNGRISQLQILGRALEHLTVFSDKKTAYTYLTYQDLKELHYEKGDTEGIVNYGLSIEGIEFAAIFIEQNQGEFIKISFRSQGDFDVNQFARTYFNGGGHINAAGGKSMKSLEETLVEFKEIIENQHP